jgi:hypothetical protein
MIFSGCAPRRIRAHIPVGSFFQRRDQQSKLLPWKSRRELDYDQRLEPTATPTSVGSLKIRLSSPRFTPAGFGPLGFDGAGNPLTAPTDRDFSDSCWPADPKANRTNSSVPMFPLLDPTAIQLWIGDEILPVFIASRTRPGIDVVWVTIPPDIIVTTLKGCRH